MECVIFTQPILTPYLGLHTHTVQMCIKVLSFLYKCEPKKIIIYLVFLCTYYTAHITNEGLPLSD
jgi:hypothetical protein